MFLKQLTKAPVLELLLDDGKLFYRMRLNARREPTQNAGGQERRQTSSLFLPVMVRVDDSVG